jgi:hypothetical protein
MAKAVATMQQAQQQLQALSLGSDDVAHLNHFDPFTVDLGVLNTKKVIEVPAKGFGVFCLVQGTHPGARLRLKLNGLGNGVPNFSIGRRVRGVFENFTVEPEPGCPTVGKVFLLVLRTPFADMDEGTELGNNKPSDLLGSFDGTTITFVSVGSATDPTGAPGSLTGAFQIDGCSKLSVLINGNSNGGNATSFDLVPWCSRADGSNIWLEQGTARVSVPDSDVSGQQYRIVTFTCQGRGWMFFAIRNLLSVSRNALGFYVEGYP